MKIKEISCEQFAGLHGREYNFENGLNLIVGDNETGKSSLVDLIYHLFFQNAKVSSRDKTDRAFLEKYFPKNAGDVQGDTIDGTVRFETEKGTYKLNKEWGKGSGNAKLTLPEGVVIKDSEAINKVLTETLVYGKGVYDELLFSSQRRDQTLLGSLLGKTASGTMEELSAVVTQAVMETGGIAVDKMEKELKETVESYERHWDFMTNMPEGGKKRGFNTPWQQGVGKILEAYYKKEAIAAERNNAEAAEKAVEKWNGELNSLKTEQKEKQDQRNRFSKVNTLLETRQINEKLLGSYSDKLKSINDALEDWPQKEQALKRADKLRTQLEQAETHGKYDAVKQLIEEKKKIQDDIAAIGEIDEADVKRARGLETALLKLEAKLQGINLVATIKNLEEKNVFFKSLVTGEELVADNGVIDITESVEICIPGVAEICLAPKGINVDEIRNQRDEKESELEEIFACYSVNSLDDLVGKIAKLDDLKKKLDNREQKIEDVLAKETWEGLKAKACQIPNDLASKEDIEKEIGELCGRESLDGFIGGIKGAISRYEKDYSSKEKLSQEKNALAEKKEELQNEIDNAEEIPEEFRTIKDPKQYDESLSKDIKKLEDAAEKCRKELSEAEKKLHDKSAEEYSEGYERAVSEFEDLKKEHARWKHIQDVFLNIKAKAKDDPLKDVEQYFRDNLTALSEGIIVLDSIDNKFGSMIKSGNSRLTESTLSEGTKDTISLAFRLAVLKHLYPEGGCTAVFDDPFTDMDPKRTSQACRLLQEFAKNNQVIFVTCDNKYLELLKGNVIKIARQ